MTRIRFTSDQVYETLGPNRGPRFPAGFVLDEGDAGAALGVPQDRVHVQSFMDRWIGLGAAEYVGDHVEASDPTSIEIVGKPATPALTPLGTAKRGEATPGLDDDGEQVEKIDLGKLTRGELDDLAKKRGVDITGAANKADVIAALERAELGE